VPLLVVLTAGCPLSWSWERVLIPQPRRVLDLPPLAAARSAALLEARAFALAWADGYPLALVVRAEALRAGRDPGQPADRAFPRQQLTERVLCHGALLDKAVAGMNRAADIATLYPGKRAVLSQVCPKERHPPCDGFVMSSLLLIAHPVTLLYYLARAVMGSALLSLEESPPEDRADSEGRFLLFTSFLQVEIIIAGIVVIPGITLVIERHVQ
jgi:hypothetical protein